MERQGDRGAARRGDGEIDRALLRLTPPAVRGGSRWIDAADIGLLHAGESASVERAVAKRRREFATGRALLRDLLGLDVTIPVGAGRRPVLPAGVRASLAHDDQIAVAVLTHDPGIRALGIDVEPATPLTRDLADAILRDDERRLDARLAFVLKEAAYKAWSSLGGPLLDHHDVRVVIGSGTFAAEIVQRGVVIEGRFDYVGGRCLAVAAVPTAPEPSGASVDAVSGAGRGRRTS